MLEVSLAGFAGCVGSSDATHFGMEQLQPPPRKCHKGPKLPMPSRTYNLRVNHRHLILSTCGHPA